MTHKVMICGIDCFPGNANCNNYCNYDKNKPMPDRPLEATIEIQLEAARLVAIEKLREAEKAWYKYFCLCEVGPDRERASQVYENVRTATRL